MRIALAMIALVSACDEAPDAITRLSITPETLVDESPHVRPLPTDLPLDHARAALGERLFADPGLSGDGTVACTSCHDLSDGGDAGTEVSDLPTRVRGPINVPTVFNVRFQFRWAWNGRFTAMADQIDAAMRAPHAMHIETAAAVEHIRPRYAADFAHVFPNAGLSVDTFHLAMTEYLYSLTTPNAPFDLFLQGGHDDAISAEAREGWETFQHVGCVSCHQGTNIGGNMFQRFGVMDDYFAPPRDPLLPADEGRYPFTHDPDDMHVFRVPSLRNVALTAPYFHDGRTATLPEAVRTMASFQLGEPLSDHDVDCLVAFLESLTGEQPARMATPVSTGT